MVSKPSEANVSSCRLICLHVLPTAPSSYGPNSTGRSTGLDVTPVHLEDDGTVSKGREFNHGAIFAGWVLDGMGRVKLAKSGAYSASVMACQFCGMTGIACCGFMRQLGYAESIKPKIGKCKDVPIRMGVNDEFRELSHPEQAHRGLETARALVAGK